MKQRISALGFLLLCMTIFASVTACYASREKAYYSNRGNFITEEAVVENIIYIQESNKIVLWLTDIDPSYQAKEFMISGDNASEAIENEIMIKVNIGDTIIFTSAPHYFGNGYFMPIIGITIENTEILNMETGYQNLMNSYK